MPHSSHPSVVEHNNVTEEAVVRAPLVWGAHCFFPPSLRVPTGLFKLFAITRRLYFQSLMRER